MSASSATITTTLTRDDGSIYHYHARELLTAFLCGLDSLSKLESDPLRAEGAAEMLKQIRKSEILGAWEDSSNVGSVYREICEDQDFLSKLFEENKDNGWNHNTEYEELWWNWTYGRSILEGPRRFAMIDNKLLVDREARKVVCVVNPDIPTRYNMRDFSCA